MGGDHRRATVERNGTTAIRTVRQSGDDRLAIGFGVGSRRSGAVRLVGRPSEDSDGFPLPVGCDWRRGPGWVKGDGRETTGHAFALPGPETALCRLEEPVVSADGRRVVADGGFDFPETTDGEESPTGGKGRPTENGEQPAVAGGFEGVRTRPEALEIDEWLDHPEYVEFLESFGELSAPDDELDLTDLLGDEPVDTDASGSPTPEDGSTTGEFELAALASRFRALAAYTDGLEAFVDGNVAAEELLAEVREEQTRLREELEALSASQSARADRLDALESEVEAMASRWERLDELFR